MRERQPEEGKRGIDRQREIERRRRETKECCNANCHKQKQPQNLLATSYLHICTLILTHTHTHGQSNMQCIISVLSYATPMRPLRLIKFKSECFLVAQIAKQTNSPKRNKKSLTPSPPAGRRLLPSCLPWQIVNTVPASAIFTHAHAKVYSEKMTSATIVSIELSQSGVFSYSQLTLPSLSPS